MNGTEIYKRTATYERESRNIRLHAPQWKLLLAFDGQKTLAEVAQGVDSPLPEAVSSTLNFLKQEWIEEQPLTLEQYLKRAGAPEPAPVTPAEPKAPSPVVIVAPAEAQHVPPPLPIAPIPSPAFGIATPKADPPATPFVQPPPATRPMRLGAVVDFITSQVGNISLGQLLVYRVFLRVPPELLLAEDVASVHLVNDTSFIKGDKLQKAIGDAVNDVTHRFLPDSVFAPA